MAFQCRVEGRANGCCLHFIGGPPHKPVPGGWEHNACCCHCGTRALVMVRNATEGHGHALPMPAGLSANEHERVA